MLNQFSRTELLIGTEGVQRLKAAKVAVFGVGGVGGYTVEALARSGVGALDLFDNDTFCLTNLNRQLHATHKTLGQYKVDAVRERVLDINPEAKVGAFRTFYLPETAEQVDLAQYDYVVDAIDTIAGKIELAVRCYEEKIPFMASMGAGNKLEAAKLEVADLFDTSVCPLAKVMRYELKRRGIGRGIKVVYSREVPIVPTVGEGREAEQTHRRQLPGSTAFVPAAAGLIIAGEAIRDLSRR
ncbi:MAG: tRNA threonylcarbamoyladenosine dehydratase [Oscillospiraceae bacterium]|nr:tRNA threonylcarbamoyladenosine dehydratase [Oscillospiraceae bacterium]